MDDLNGLDGRFLSRMRIIALDKDGNHAGFASIEGLTYIYQTTDMFAPAEVARTCVPIQSKWE